MQLRRNVLLAIMIILFIYFEVHSCSEDRPTAPDGNGIEAPSIICNASDVHFIDEQYGWVVGSLGTVMTTQNSGSTWEGMIVDEHTLNDVQFVDAAWGWIAGRDGALFKTDDGGVTWEKVASSGFPQDEDFYEIHFMNDTFGFVLGYQGVYKTENAGLDWANHWLPVIPYRGAWDMCFVNENVGFLLGSRWTDPNPVLLYRTGDGGLSWTGVEGSEHSVLRTVLTIEFIDQNTGWAGGGVIMKTIDGGRNWETQRSEATVREFLFFNDQHGFAVGGKTVLRTKDGGDTWDDVTPDDERVIDLRGVFFHDVHCGWIVGRGNEELVGSKLYKYTVLLYTDDGGDTWSIKDFPFDYTSFQATGEQ